VDHNKPELELAPVDNTIEGSLKRLISARPEFKDVIFVHEPKIGIPFARNAAVKHSRLLNSDYIAFIDDDEIAPPTWIADLYAHAQTTGADVVHGGLIRAPSVADAIGLARTYERQDARIRDRKTAATNNTLFRASLVAGSRALSFDEQLDKAGGSDTEFFMRAHDAGAKIVRVTHPPVFEVWDETRAAPAYLWKRSWRCGASANYRYRKNRSAGYAVAVLLGRAASRAVGGGAAFTKSAALAAFAPARARTARDKGLSSLGFAAGCLSPYVAVRPTSYY
ncbi:MAG: glycosyltransferase, partial [Pseudomonadota bacterium]